MLKFSKAMGYLPDPERSRPYITDEEKELGTATPAHPVPFHCKPWMDEQSLGWTLFYGYLTPITIIGLGDGQIQVENFKKLQAESQVKDIVKRFFSGRHVGIPATGYSLLTEPNWVSLMLPPTHPPAGYELVSGVLETDWYPLETPVLFRLPAKGVEIKLEYKTELARVVPMPRRRESAVAVEMSGEEHEALLERRAAYLRALEETEGKPLVSGAQLKQIYHKWSAERRRETM
ncbi:MAG TPA: hypothetical protein VLL52_25655 [Anaerolineae bacterium]|nr:hypothetical protein [Anaerolineae bacterium]